MLTLTMPKVQAWESLQDHEYVSKLTMDGFKDLLLAAGYSEDVAHKAAMERGWNRLAEGLTM